MGKVSVPLPAVDGEFQVEGFDEKYEEFLRANPSSKAQLNLIALLLIIVGGLAAINGVLSWFMGYRLIIFKLSSSLFFSSYVSVQVVFVFLVGASVCLIGIALFKEGAGLSAERFLAEEYELVSEEGVLPDTAYFLQYLGESHFLVKRRFKTG